MAAPVVSAVVTAAVVPVMRACAAVTNAVRIGADELLVDRPSIEESETLHVRRSA